MKILLLTNMWPVKDRPHFGIFVKNFYEELTKRNIAAHVLKPDNLQKGLFGSLRKYLELRSKVFKLKERFDICQVEFAFPTDIASWGFSEKKFKKKVVVFHGSDVYLWQRVPLGKLFYKNIFKKADAVVFPSKHAAKFIKEHFKKLPENIFIIPRGIDSQFLKEGSKEEARSKLGIEKEEIVILSVANFIPLKNQKTIVEALKGLSTDKKVRMIFVGDGPEKPEVEEKALKITSTNLSIEFPGPVPREKVYLYFEASDIFVSASFSEGFPVTIQEAMAKGLCVVASDIPPHHEAIEPFKTGLFFNPSNPNELRDILQMVIEDENVRKALGEEAKKSPAIWTMEKTVDEYLKVYNLILS